MSLFSSAKNFVGSLFGGDDEDKKKKQQQAQVVKPQQQQQPGQKSVLYEDGSVGVPRAPGQPVQLDNSVKLDPTMMPQNLKKAAPKQVQPVQPSQPDQRKVTFEDGSVGYLKHPAQAQAIPSDALGNAPAKNNDGPYLPEAQNQKPQESFAHHATHNIVTDLAGGIVKLPVQAAENWSNTFGNLGRKAAGGNNRTIQENMGNVQPLRKVLDMSGASGTNAQLAGDAAQVATSVLAPGFDSIAGTALAKAAPTVTNAVVKTVVPKVAAGVVTGGMFGAEGAAGEGGDIKDVAKSAGQNALFGGVLGGVGAGVSMLRKPVEVAPGVKSVNPNQEADAQAHAAAEQARQEALVPTARMNALANDPLMKGVRSPTMTGAQGLPTEMPAGGQNIVSPRDIEVASNPQSVIGEDRTPAFMRQAPEPATPEPLPDLTDAPAFERQGKTLPSKTLESANDNLRNNATDLAAEPAMAPAMSQSYMATGAKDPLSLIMHHLSQNPNKAEVRAIVQRLLPEADQNTVNRAVNSITGADNVADVSHALTEAEMRVTNPQPLGALSDAPAPPVDAARLQQPGNFNPAPAERFGDPVPVDPARQVSDMTPPPEVAPEVPVATPPVAPEAPAVAPSVNEPAAPVDAPPADGNALPQMADLPDGQVPVAPRTHDALVKELGVGEKGVYGTRGKLDIAELKNRADGVIANMSDDDVLKAFQTTGSDTMITDSNSFALARSALERLAKNDQDPAAVQAVSNIMDAIERYTSKSGEGLRIAQESFDSMPLPMKVRYIVKKIDAANTDKKGYQPLRDDPARAEQVEANIKSYLQKSQDINENISGIQAQLAAVADAAKNGEKSTVNIKQLTRDLRDHERQLAQNNGELVKYYSDLVPGRSFGQRALNDFPRRMMLASFTGRVNDVLTTTANITHLGIQNAIQGTLAKAVNLVKPGAVTDTLKGQRAFWRGTGEGIKRGASEFKGAQYVDDVQRGLNGSADLRTGLQKAPGPIGRTIQAATEFATKASEGVRDQRLYQLADKEASQLGLKGGLRRQYAEARAAVPSDQMRANADALHKEINNLNENPISRGLNRISASIEGKSGVGGLIKNQVMPFTSWLGGNIWNTVTDKNVIANAVKIADSARKGDMDSVVRNISKFGTNAAITYGVGYLLTQQGIITTKDAEGYNDAGAYFHVGDRYIPVGFAGFFAPSIILGNAGYNAVNAPEGSSASQEIERGIWNIGKSINAIGALGADNNITRAFDAANRPGGSPADGAASFAGGAVSQYIPALTGDVNAVLNNGLKVGGKTVVSDGLNPTHEAPLTKVANPNSPSGQAKDVPKSTVASIKSRIPFMSQQLPRKANVAADDLVDRTTKGDRDTGGAKQARADAQAKTDQAADFKKRNIPDPNGKNFDAAVESRIEEGKYDAAIEGLKAKAELNKKDPNIPQSKTKEIQTKITTLEVTKKGGFTPDTIDLYKKTSLTEWRDMGDPESDNYDPKTYSLLYRYDKALADSSVSRNNTKADQPFFSAKEDKKKSGSGSSAADANLKRIQSNTIGSTPDLAKISLGDLRPQKADSVKIPTIQQIRSSDLIKKRAIKVGRV